MDLLACVGKRATAIADASLMTGVDAESIVRFADAASAAKALPKRLKKDDLVLLKASRGIGLEVVAQAIAERIAPRRKAAS